MRTNNSRKRSARQSTQLGFETVERRLLLAGDLVISEFQASNQSTIVDQDGDTSDWIELYNSGAAPISLLGWHLTDDQADLFKWQLPEVTMAANSYQLVFASGKDRATAGEELHANFKLSADGEYLALVSPDGQSITDFDSTYPAQLADLSFGRATNDALRYYATPSPGLANDPADSFIGIADLPTFSLESGFYDEPLSLSLSTELSEGTIRYTLDASEPTLESPLYTAPLQIESTAIVRGAVFADDYLTADDDSRSYLFLDDVLRQDGGGLPDTWGEFSHNFPLGTFRKGDSVPANYEMDPDVVNDPRYRSTLKDDLLDIPTLSLVFAPDDLWSEETGIYSNPLQSGLEWERPVRAEWINTDGSIGFRVDAGGRISGAFSRRPSASAKHSIRLLFKSEYGPSQLDYPLFGDNGADEFDTVVLRASYNFSWSRGERNNSQHAADGTFVQDRWASVTQNEMGGLAPQGNWVHLYLNGLYWGIYNPNERPDSSFLASYQGGTPDDYDVIKIGEIVDGDDEAWQNLLDLVRQDPIDYDAVQQAMDVANFADYMMLNHFGGNEDWPQNNWYASRRREEGARWQFHSWDAEYLFREKNLSRVRATSQVEAGPGEICLRLSTVEEFRVAFGDRIQKHFFHGGVLTPEASIARLNAVAAPIDRAVVGESARWGDALFNNIEPALTRDDHWLPRLEELRTEYFPERTDIVLNQYRNFNLYPSTQAPLFSQHGGLVSPDFELAIQGDANSYFTLDGSDPRLPGGSISPNALRYDTPIPLPFGASVLARSLQNGEWSALVVGDFVVDQTPTLQISEILYHPSDEISQQPYSADDYEFIEFTNWGAAPLNTLGITLSGAVEFEFPSMMVLPGERIVVVEDAKAFESEFGEEPKIAGQFVGQLDNSGDTLLLDDGRGKSIAIVTYDDVGPWPARADGAGASLEPIDLTATGAAFGAATNWRGSVRLHGTPGSALDNLLPSEIDQLFASIRAKPSSKFYDLNESGKADEDDIQVLVRDILQTRTGDVNLDGSVDFADFLVLSANFGASNASWSDGDFDGNQSVDFADFLALSTNFGFLRESK